MQLSGIALGLCQTIVERTIQTSSWAAFATCCGYDLGIKFKMEPPPVHLLALQTYSQDEPPYQGDMVPATVALVHSLPDTHLLRRRHWPRNDKSWASRFVPVLPR